MNSIQIYEALLKGGKGEIVKVDGSKEDLLAAMRKVKAEQISLMGGIELSAEYKGTNIRKVNLTDAVAVGNVFKQFTCPLRDSTKHIYADVAGNGLIGTDGVYMLVSRIPEGFVPSGEFNTDVGIRWTQIAGEIEATDYNLSNHRRMATIRKGDAKHGFLQTAAEAAKAYGHMDEHGLWNFLCTRIGDKWYETRRLAKSVDALFKFGCSAVAVCEKVSWVNRINGTTALHLFGLYGTVAAKAVLMPVRYADEGTGAFVMPLDKESGRSAA